MTCHNCRSECKRHGHDRKGNQRFQCRQCSKTFLEAQDKPLEGMYLPLDKAELILKLMVDGNSLSAISRITGVHMGTITKLLTLVGEKCERIMGRCVRNVRVQLLPDSQEPPGDSRNGCRDLESGLGDQGPAGGLKWQNYATCSTFLSPKQSR